MNNRRMNEYEIRFFKNVYPNITNGKLTEMFSIDKQHVEYLAKKYKLKKSDSFWRESRQFAAEKSHDARRLNKIKKSVTL